MLGSQRSCLVKWFVQGQAIMGVQSVKISSVLFFSSVCFIHNQQLCCGEFPQRGHKKLACSIVLYIPPSFCARCPYKYLAEGRKSLCTQYVAGELEWPQYSYTMLCER